MSVLLSRRGILRCLTGIIAAPAIVKADALMKVVAVPKTPPPLICPKFRYVRVSLPSGAWRKLNDGGVPLNALTEFQGWDEQAQGWITLRPSSPLPAPQHGSEGGIAAGQLRLG